jgi:hypothetical protein
METGRGPFPLPSFKGFAKKFRELRFSGCVSALFRNSLASSSNTAPRARFRAVRHLFGGGIPVGSDKPKDPAYHSTGDGTLPRACGQPTGGTSAVALPVAAMLAVPPPWPSSAAAGAAIRRSSPGHAARCAWSRVTSLWLVRGWLTWPAARAGHAWPLASTWPRQKTDRAGDPPPRLGLCTFLCIIFRHHADFLIAYIPFDERRGIGGHFLVS